MKLVTLNLKQGLGENQQYKAWKFPGGELHIVLSQSTVIDICSEQCEKIMVESRISCSDDFMLLALCLDVLEKEVPQKEVIVRLGYMPYQQADRDFSKGESFSLSSFASMLSYLPYSFIGIYDPHSDVSPALVRKALRVSNDDFIRKTIVDINDPNLIILSPDAGAYKKVSKLISNIGFKGEFVAANKYRNTSSGNIESLELSKQDFEGKPVLIVDDICIGGRTFVELAKVLKTKNVGKLYLAVSHGIFFSGWNNDKQIYSSSALEEYFETIYTTDTIRDFSISPKVKIIYNFYDCK